MTHSDLCKRVGDNSDMYQIELGPSASPYMVQIFLGARIPYFKNSREACRALGMTCTEITGKSEASVLFTAFDESHGALIRSVSPVPERTFLSLTANGDRNKGIERIADILVQGHMEPRRANFDRINATVITQLRRVQNVLWSSVVGAAVKQRVSSDLALKAHFYFRFLEAEGYSARAALNLSAEKYNVPPSVLSHGL